MNLLKGLGLAILLAMLGQAVDAFSAGAEWNLSPFIVPTIIGFAVLCWIGIELSALNAHFQQEREQKALEQ